MKILNQNDTNTRGILIEYDAGHIKPSENKSVIREMKEMNKDNFVLYAVLQKYDTPNKNGRIYGERILKRETDNYKTLIEQGRALGELNHPETSLVDLERTSHRITECWWDGKILMGKVELLTSEAFRSTGQITCMGDIAANLLLHGVTLGISSRGVGSLKKSGEYNEVQDDFELLCWDFVSTPSNPGSWMAETRSLNESINNSTYQYGKVDEIIREILCAKGTCPIL